MERSGCFPSLIFLHPRRNAHSQLLNQHQVQGQQQGGDPRQHRDVETEEARQRGAGNLIAASQEHLEPIANEGHKACHVRAHFGGEECQRVPGKRYPENPNASTMKKSNIPLTHVSSRGFRYAFMKKTLNMWMKTMKIIRLADQLWMERISHPNLTCVMMN